jgi:hypothetical protein
MGTTQIKKINLRRLLVVAIPPILNDSGEFAFCIVK